MDWEDFLCWQRNQLLPDEEEPDIVDDVEQYPLYPWEV